MRSRARKGDRAYGPEYVLAPGCFVNSRYTVCAPLRLENCRQVTLRDMSFYLTRDPPQANAAATADTS